MFSNVPAIRMSHHGVFRLFNLPATKWENLPTMHAITAEYLGDILNSSIYFEKVQQKIPIVIITATLANRRHGAGFGDKTDVILVLSHMMRQMEVEQ